MQVEATRKHYFQLNSCQSANTSYIGITDTNQGRGSSPKISQEAVSGLDMREV